MSLSSDARNALQSGCVAGILHWDPPAELSKELSGSRRGQHDGFWVGSWGGGSSQNDLACATYPVDPGQARTIAKTIDEAFTLKPHRRHGDTAVQWVDRILRYLPVALNDAIAASDRRTNELAQLRAYTQGMSHAAPLGLNPLADDPDDDPPF